MTGLTHFLNSLATALLDIGTSAASAFAPRDYSTREDPRRASDGVAADMNRVFDDLAATERRYLGSPLAQRTGSRTRHKQP